MNSVTLSRHVALETVSVEAFLTVDGQGLPTYDSPVDVDARVLQQTKLVVAADGSRIKTALSLWVPSGAALMPDEQDRVTWSSKIYIVMDVKHVKDRDAQTIHRRVRCRRE
ncbi:hypothetical protein LCGC14_2573940 [marine sediment metagenome]|uniref:Uncharacterized protein n=1 Tax=marine sediment metagenome TaxID=412755 RepID=A0A0F9CSM7_9ZZZZ